MDATALRYLTDHQIDPTQRDVQITVIDQPGHGGANHWYRIDLPVVPSSYVTHIRFQEGPVGEQGWNGLTMETLLAINIDRLRGFQRGSYACRENALALTHLEEALHWLQHRTRARLARGVEGTSRA